MSYDIYIGERVEDRHDDGERYERVDHVELPNAPCFVGDEMTGNGNSRHPSYGGWSDFCGAVGLHDLFFGQCGLMRHHPGIAELKPEHRDAVRGAIEKWKRTHHREPGWDDPPPPDATMKDRIAYMTREPVQRDPMLARLIWLDWWMTWAIDNCRRPAIFNS